MEQNFWLAASEITSAEVLSSRPKFLADWWQRIRNAYGEPQRHYHTLEHIRAMCTALDSVVPENLVNDRNLVLMAIFFHDIVYDPRAKGGENELRSIDIWNEFAHDAQIKHEIREQVSDLIRATIKHALPGSAYPKDLPMFLDLDLEVLGRKQEDYAKYASSVRQEYAHYPLEEYCAGRIKVLEHLRKGDIYFTVFWRSRLAKQARENMVWEIEMLRKGHIPGNDSDER